MSTPSDLPFHTRRRGILFVISAPSGAGKSTLLHGIRHFADFHYSVSCTTRSPRPGETNGEDYHFLSRDQFETEISNSNLLEYAEVHGNFYGTRKDAIKEHLAHGTDVLVDVDVQGARSIRKCEDPAITSALADIFLAPPSMEILTQRLHKRATESPEQLQLRLNNAILEMQCWREYQYLLISGSPEHDQRQFRALMESERLRTFRLNTEEPQ
ncbi:MAG: guanylate kinase [Verrucomicrobia bacterium]|nr:MAG: guanylate kinase [Verrucomicrobiota bacterium]